MIEIVTDASEESLMEAVEKSLQETWKVLALSPRVELREDERLLRFATGVRHPALNGVLRCAVPATDADEAIDGILALFRGRRLPFTWWTGPQTRPADIGARLQARGLALHDTPLMGAAADLTKLIWMGGSPAGFTVELAQDANSYRTYQEVYTHASRLPTAVGDAMAEIVCDIGFAEDVPLLHYLGRLNGKPIATAMLSLAGGVAGVYDVVALPEAHAQGIEMAMALTAFLDAREWDFRIGVMHVSHLAFNSLRHLGLQEQCEIKRYVWTPPAPAGSGEEPSAAA